ncbi:MAG: SulP family inorganic anion transporter [Actinobacteria bacterium]|nr:SulP family inorganic anion transporter [Actinomycetota bacterium]
MRLAARLPILTSLRGYRRAWLPRDLTAGVLIVALAIPLSMGMAELAGMPPVAGLYSCILPLVAYAFFGSSPQLVVALDASTAAMLGAAVAPLAGGDPLRYAALAGGLTLLTGIVLLVAGAARLGLIADFLSEPVLLGYQAGLALVVTAGQLPRLFGVTVQAESTLGQYWELVVGLGDPQPWSAALGIAALLIVLLTRRLWPVAPGALVALVLGAAAVFAFDLESAGVAVLGEIPSGLPPLGVPDVSWGDLRQLLPAAAAIALLAAADTLVSSRVFAARGRYAVDADRDLVGLGAANAVSALSGGIATSASAARTAVAESVGSRTQVAGLTAAALMVVVLLVLTGPLAYVPVAVLAAIVVAAVLRLIDLKALRTLWRVRRVELVIALAALAGVVAVGLLQGVVIAMGLSLLDFLWRTSSPHDAVLGRAPGRGGFHDTTRVRDAAAVPGTLVYRFDAPLFYANAERFRSRVLRLVGRHPGTRFVVLDASPIADIDVTAGRMLGELQEQLGADGVRLVVAAAVGRVYDLLVGDELKVDFTAGDMYDTIGEALSAERGRPAPAADDA